MSVYRFFARSSFVLLTLLVSLAFTACGGGGGDTPASAASSTPNTPTPQITVDLTPVVTSMSPGTAAVGAKITVTGKNLSRVTAVRIGSLSFSPSSVSETSLEFTVPAGATSARIELISPAGSSLSVGTLVVIGIPTVGSISPSTALPGESLTISGTNLDQVSSITLNGVPLTIEAGRSATRLVIKIPDAASTGFLTIIATDGVSRLGTVQITVNAPLKLTSFSPASALVGASVSLNGTGFDRVTRVNFSGTTTAASITARSTSSMTITVPTGAATGPIQMIAGSENASSSTNFAVIPRISVNSAAVYNVATAGLSVAITGTGLDQVSSVTVASTNASITSRSATQLVFSAPNGLLCGAITLSSLTQPSVAAGNLVVGAGCVSGDITISDIEFAQINALRAAATYQRLVPGKETWVRAYVTSRTANKTAPTVRLTALAGSTVLGSLTMTGPTPLPVLAAGSTPTDAMRYSITQTFRVQLPDSWVDSGLKVRIDVDPSNPAGVQATQEATPVMGEPITMDVILVPLISGTTPPAMPSTTTVADAIIRAFPVPRSKLTVTTRAPVTLTMPFTDEPSSYEAWGQALRQLAILAGIEGPDKIWYGLIKVPSSGTLGTANTPGRVGVGMDTSIGPRWERVMVHEMGHNFSLQHANCTGDNYASNPDPQYPYASGKLGSAPLFNSLSNLVADPRVGDAIWDVMGYCGGFWFSDYNIAKIQPYLERRTSAKYLLKERPLAASETSLIMVSGLIDARGARISQVLPIQGVQQVTSQTGYELELRTATGQVILHPVQVDPIDHIDAKLFSASVANPGQLLSMRILHNGQVIGEKTAAMQLRENTLASTAEAGVPWARVNESGAQATFEWNAAYGTASVIHALNGQRTVLTLQASGGRVALDISALPRGGVFEIGLSDGLNVHGLTLTR